MQDALGEVQSVLVLGGGSDIGRSLCVRLARTRCRTVILAGRPEDDMEPVAEAVRAAGAETVELVHWDSTDVESHQKVIDDVFDRHGEHRRGDVSAVDLVDRGKIEPAEPVPALHART